MATAIRMPDLGTTVETVTIASWLKNEGDAVKRGDALCEVETDKATSELESVAEGVLLRQVVPAGTDVESGDLIAWVGAPGESVPEGDSGTPAGPQTVPSATPAERRPEHGAAAEGRATKPEVPLLVRNLARQLGVDLSKVAGTGPGGRITREDVRRAARR